MSDRGFLHPGDGGFCEQVGGADRMRLSGCLADKYFFVGRRRELRAFFLLFLHSPALFNTRCIVYHCVRRIAGHKILVIFNKSGRLICRPVSTVLE